MKQKKIFIILTLCLTLGLACAMYVSAADDVIMVAFDYEYIRDLKSETLPFFSGGVLYIYYGDYARLDAIDSANYNARLQLVQLYNINQKLTFDLANNQTYDENGDKLDGVAMWRSGRIYLPVSTVREKFDLYYSYVSNAKPTPVVILRSPGKGIQVDSVFIANTEILRTDTIWANYLASIEPRPTDPGTSQPPPVVTDPTTPAEDPEPEPRLAYMTFDGAFTEETPDILAALHDAGAKATFFVPPQSIAGSAELIRRAYTEGHTIGLLMEAEEDLAQALEEANCQMKAMVFSKARLVRIAGGADLLEEDERDRVIGAGFRLWDSTMPLAGDAAAIAGDARSGLYRSTTTSVIGLEHSRSAVEAIPEILQYIRNNHFNLLSMKEWDTPINRAGDVR